jgi:short-subunit dehydrogenase
LAGDPSRRVAAALLEPALRASVKEHDVATKASQRPLAVVTGASSGIGYELANQFAKNGYDLVICAEDPGIQRAAEALRTGGTDVQAVEVDLSTYDGVERLYGEIERRGAPVEAIAINAGVGVGGDFARETELSEELKMINLNVVSTVHLAKRVTRDMVRRGKGRVLITASEAGTTPTPLSAVYGATKAFDLSFAASLRHELKDTGVSVTALMPGPTDTEFFERAGIEDTKLAELAQHNSPADVAKQGFEALMAGKDRIFAASSLQTKLEGMSARFMPESAKAALHKKRAEPGSRSD